MKQHLYTKLLILYFVLGGICFLLLSSGGSYLVEKRLERSTGESLYRAASQMVSGNELRQSVKDPENASLSLALSSAAAFQNADFWVMDTDGTVLINTDEQSSGSGEITVKNFRPADYENICYSSGTFYGTFKTTQLSTVVPIKDTDQVIGYLAIHYPMKNLYESRSNIVEVMILIFIVIYALFFSFLLIYFYRVHKPLKKILKGALEFANGNLSYTIPVDSEDEMGYLSHSLNYMADKLNKNGEYQRQFISNVSHDFRSPLTSIKGYVEAMLDGTIPPEMQERYLKVIAFESTRLEKLTRSLLTLNELAQELMRKYPDLELIAGMNEYSAVGVGRAVSDAGAKDKIAVVGVDCSQEAINLMEMGVYKGIIVQKAFRMGYIGVEETIHMLNGDAVEKNIDSGCELVTPENMYNSDIERLIFPFS